MTLPINPDEPGICLTCLGKRYLEEYEMRAVIDAYGGPPGRCVLCGVPLGPLGPLPPDIVAKLG